MTDKQNNSETQDNEPEIKQEALEEAEAESDQVEVAEQIVDKPGLSPVFKWLLLFAVLLGGFSTAASYVLWTKLQNQKQAVNRSVSGLVEEKVAASELALKQSMQNVQTQVDKAIGAYQQLEANQQRIEKQLRYSPDNNQHLIEAESLLRLAQNRLELSGDIETAVLALKMADNQLQLLNHSGVIPVRQQIEKELKQLQSISVPDSALYLNDIKALLTRADTLPLLSAKPKKIVPKLDPEPQQKQEQDWKQTLKGMLGELKPLVAIRKHNRATPAMLSIEEEKLVRMVLKSRYEVIKQAVMLNDQGNIHRRVNEALDWLKRYFDIEHEDSLTTIKVLENIRVAKFIIDYPELGLSSKLLADFRIQNRQSIQP